MRCKPAVLGRLTCFTGLAHALFSCNMLSWYLYKKAGCLAQC